MTVSSCLGEGVSSLGLRRNRMLPRMSPHPDFLFPITWAHARTFWGIFKRQFIIENFRYKSRKNTSNARVSVTISFLLPLFHLPPSIAVFSWNILKQTLDIMSGFPGGSVVKNLPANAGDARDILHLAFDPWVGKIPWSRRWQATLVFLPGKSHGQRSLVGSYNPWGHTELNTT